MFTLVHFSPTGNAEYVAGLLARALEPHGVTMLALGSFEIEALVPAEQLVVIAPIHGFNAARAVERFAEALPGGLYDGVSLVLVGCADHWINEAASRRLRSILASTGYEVRVDALVPMPLTFVTAFPEELARALVADAEGRAAGIANAVANGYVTDRRVPFKSRLVSALGRVESPAARLFGLELHASPACTSCGRCWSSCPAENISKGPDGRPRFAFRCTMCMRCIYRCPETAIAPRLSKFLVIKDGYSLSRYLSEGSTPNEA